MGASMRWEKLIVMGASLAALGLGGMSAWSDVPAGAGQAREAYRPVPMPPGFRVEATELEGPVFADARGKTLYVWPQHELRDGYVGDPKGASLCTSIKETTTDGLMDPYPAGCGDATKLHGGVADCTSGEGCKAGGRLDDHQAQGRHRAVGLQG